MLSLTIFIKKALLGPVQASVLLIQLSYMCVVTKES